MSKMKLEVIRFSELQGWGYRKQLFMRAIDENGESFTYDPRCQKVIPRDQFDDYAPVMLRQMADFLEFGPRGKLEELT